MRSADEIKRMVKEVYDAIAEGFYHIRTRPWGIVNKLSECRYLADIGCGTGTQLMPLLKQGSYGICIDISSPMLLKALERFRKLDLYSYVDAVQADAEHLPLRSYSIECILSIATVHHLPKGSRENALKEIERVLRIGGKALITVWSLYQPKFLAKLIANLFKYILGLTPSPRDFFVPWRYRKRKYVRYYHLFTRNELKELISRNTSLKIVEYGVYNLRKTVFHQNYYALAVKDNQA